MAYKKSSETGMFDQEFTLEALSGIGNPLKPSRRFWILSSSAQYLSLFLPRKIAKVMQADGVWTLCS